MNTWLDVVGTLFLCYFILLDGVYAVLFAISFYQSGVHMRRLALGGDDIVLRSPLTPPVSIILPAFNEEACIVDSVDALRLLEYGTLEIIVVDDGSTDSMLARLDEAHDLVPSRAPVRLQLPSHPVKAVYVSRRLPNLVVVSKVNGGCKADALNAGVNAARYPLVCVTDADAILEKDALLRAVRPFIELPRETIAVGGTVRIVNGCTVSVGRVTRVRAPRNLLAALQVVEYMRAFIASRTAWSRLGGLVPHLGRLRRLPQGRAGRGRRIQRQGDRRRYGAGAAHAPRVPGARSGASASCSCPIQWCGPRRRSAQRPSQPAQALAPGPPAEPLVEPEHGLPSVPGGGRACSVCRTSGSLRQAAP